MGRTGVGRGVKRVDAAMTSVLTTTGQFLILDRATGDRTLGPHELKMNREWNVCGSDQGAMGQRSRSEEVDENQDYRDKVRVTKGGRARSAKKVTIKPYA